MTKSPTASFASAVALATGLIGTSLMGTSAAANEDGCVLPLNTDYTAEYIIEAGPDNLNAASFAVLTPRTLNILNNKVSDIIDRETRQVTRSLRGIYTSIERHGFNDSRTIRDLDRLRSNPVFSTLADSIADGSLTTQEAAEAAIGRIRDDYRATLREFLLEDVAAISAAPLCLNAPDP